MMTEKGLDKYWEYLYYSVSKLFHHWKRFDCMKQMNALHKRHNWLMEQNFEYGKRLEPSGVFNSLMIIGINPSEKSKLSDLKEDNYGRYFGTMLKEAGIELIDVWMTNLYKQPTEGNRPLNDAEMTIGMEELELEIEMIDPTAIVVLGKQVQSLFRDVYKGIPVVKLPHPSYIQRFQDKDRRSNFINQLRSLQQYVKKRTP